MQPSSSNNLFSPEASSSDAAPTPPPPQPTTSNVEDSSEPGSVIFVGGLNDQNSAIVYNEYERFKFARPDVPSRYFPHDANRDIANYIQTLPDGVPVTLIGHSWGGDTAAKAALNLPKKVATLITIDPVGIWTPLLHSYDSIANSVGKWVNVSAQPTGEQTPGDELAKKGGRWGIGPAHAPHNFVSLNEHHDNFSHMLNQLNSYQTLINPKGAGAQ